MKFSFNPETRTAALGDEIVQHEGRSTLCRVCGKPLRPIDAKLGSAVHHDCIESAPPRRRCSICREPLTPDAPLGAMEHDSCKQAYIAELRRQNRRANPRRKK